MRIETHVRLIEILGAITQLEECRSRCGSFNGFKNDPLMLRAAERCIMIIGEAVIRITKSDDSIAITDARKIMSTRHIVVHEYDRVSADVLWTIMDRHIAPLKAEVETLLKQHG